MKVSQRPTEGNLAPPTASPTTAVRARGPRTPPRQPPLALGRYRLERQLGSGGFGTVWLARDERLEREVAVKALPRERVIGGRFEREARAAARLSHPGIVTLYEAAVDDDGAYLVSELVRGSTLDRLMAAGRLSDRDIVGIGIALCDALAHAHAHEIVHRDVKPSNVLVPERPPTPAACAKLTDFGVARVVGGDTLTRTGDVLGTAAYMAPEQAQGREAGAAADLYSLALVLYEALTGVNPLRGLAAGQRARLSAHLPPIRRYRRDLPRELARGVDLALRPRPRERGTLQELRAALDASANLVRDQPGVVEGPWRPAVPRRRRDDPGEASTPRWEASAPGWEASAPGPQREASAAPTASGRRSQAIRWPSRAAAGLAAALLAAWLTDRLSAHPLLPAPLVGLLAALAVSALPRLGWLLVALGGVISLLASGAYGGALVLAAAAPLPILLLLRRPDSWPLPGLAVVLGAAGLAGAWPALAGRARGPWRRAALAATGWAWLALAGPLVGSGLYARLPGGVPARDLWLSSPYAALHDVLPRALSPAFLAPAAVWAAAAVVLPSVALRPSPLARIGWACAWSAAVVLLTLAAPALAGGGVGIPAGTAILGALAGTAIALWPTAARRPRPPRAAGGPPETRVA